MLFLFQDRCQSYRQPASTSSCLPHTNSLRSGTHGGCYKYCKYCATGSFANILLCQILFQSGVPNCVTSKKASESFDLIALGKCNKYCSSYALQYQKYSNHTSCPLVQFKLNLLNLSNKNTKVIASFPYYHLRERQRGRLKKFWPNCIERTAQALSVSSSC